MLHRRAVLLLILVALGGAAFLWWQANTPNRAARRALERRGEGYSLAELTALAQTVPEPALWEVAGWRAWEQEQPSIAQTCLLRARSEGALSPQGYGLLGDLSAEAGNLEDAVSFWEQAVAQDAPQADLWRRKLAQVAESRGDWEIALEDYRALLQRAPTDPELICHLGMLLAVLRPAEAPAYLETAAAPASPCAALAADLQDALVRGNLQDDPVYTAVLVGRALGGRGEWHLAAEAFRRAVERNPDYAEAWAFWGQALEATGQDGSRALETALRLDPASLTAASLNALYWRARGQPEKALVYFYRAASREPQNPLWEIEIGATLAQMGNISDALAHYRKATTLSPDDPAPWRSLADFCLQYGLEIKETALPAARRSVILAPEEAASVETLGRVYLRLGDLDSARRFARRALSLDSGYAPAYLDLGLIAALRGDDVQARRMYRTVIALAPDSPAAAQARRLLQP